MSDGELKPGDGLLLRAFKDHPADTVQLSYGAPKEKGRYHLALWLGTWKEGESSVDQRLHALGWVFDPERAKLASIEARKGKDSEAGLIAEGDESAVGDSRCAQGQDTPGITGG